MRDTFVKELLRLAHKDKNIVLVTGDLGFGVLKSYWQTYPGQFINAGIAEQNMTGLAAGMAMEGKTVFTYSIGNFPTLRCLEQIRNDAAYHNANVKIVAVGGGLSYGALGMSHHATEDIAVLRALPDVVVMAPGDCFETQTAVRIIYEHKGTCYLRLGRGNEKKVHSEAVDYELGKALEILKGGEVAVFSSGDILSEAYEAAQELNKKGISAGLYSFPTVKPLDAALIMKLAQTVRIIVTVEEHNILGGFGSAVAEVIACMRARKASQIMIGLNDAYSSIVGDQAYLRTVYKISKDEIVKRVLANI